jgi:hypothetical protein
MAEIEHFLNQDWRFKGYVDGLKSVDPGPDRDAWLDKFFKGVYKYGHYKGEEIMIGQRVYQACVYVTLYDEDCADSEGLAKESEDLRKSWKSSFFDPVRGKWVHTSYVPYDPKKLGQCERTFGPSHVEYGGGDALEPYPMESERTSVPSHVEEGGGDALQRVSQDRDRRAWDANQLR